VTITERLVQWAWSLRPEDLPSGVVAAANRHLLDGIGTAIAAVRMGEAAYTRAMTARSARSPEAGVIGFGARCSAGDAAFANGALIHALDYDDTHTEALIHPTAVVAPAALAVGELHGSTPAAALRISAAAPHGFHRRGFHASSVCGVFGSALAAARLSRCTEGEAVAALGIAGSLASGSLEFLHAGTATKPIHTGWAARAGVEAALLASEGAEAPASILEGGYGLYRSYADLDVEPDAVLRGIGTVWETERIGIKPYPVCQLSHVAIDALLSVLDDLPPAEAIRAIEVRIAEDAVPVVCEPRFAKLVPRTPYEAKFSLPWDMAAIIVDRELSVATFRADRLDRPVVSRLAERISFRPFVADVPPAEAPVEMEIEIESGERLRAESTASRGTPERPLTDDELVAKFVDNCGPSIDGKELAASILTFEDQPSVGALIAATRVEEAET